jgi:hypothetical protein
MSRPALRILTAVLVLGTTCLGFVPIAQAGTTTQTLTPSTEAWYQPNPTCGQASGCLTPGAIPAPVPTNPYPAGTLHVGYTGGAETARSYLALSLDGLSGTLTAATLNVPLDVTQGDGSTSPETAHLQACLVNETITAVEGSVDASPKVSCDTHAVVTYVATPSPHLTADLSALQPGLPASKGIALLPDGETVAPSDAWRVVFSAHTRSDAAKTAAATVTLALDSGTSPVGVPVFAPEQAPPVAAPPEDTGFPSISPATGTGFVSPPDTPVVMPPAVDEAVPPPAVVQAPRTNPVAQIVRTPLGAAYPGVFLFPLALLVLVPYLGRALLADLDQART